MKFLLVPILLLSPLGLSSIQDQSRLPKIVAHRGAEDITPENTMAAFQIALDLNADIIELDIRRSSDWEVVILHDGTVDRTTDGKGSANQLAWRELQELDAGSWFSPEFAGEAIPSFREVLEWAHDKIDLLLDFKTTSSRFNEKVAEEILSYGNLKRIHLGVRSVEQAMHFRELLPEVNQLAFMRNPEDYEVYREAGVEVIRLWESWLRNDPDLPSKVRDAGGKVMIYGGWEMENVSFVMGFTPDWYLTRSVRGLQENLLKWLKE